MIGRQRLPELKIFAEVEADLNLLPDDASSTLVTPNGNGSSAGHRWFKYKESFSCDLLDHVLARYPLPKGSKDAQLLDPFCGVGTGLLSSQLAASRIESVGIECNPFSAFVAQTKLSWPQIDVKKLRTFAARALVGANKQGTLPLPSLSSIRSGRCITRHMAQNIVATRHAIEALPAGPERDALLLGLASAVEPVSRIRRDGRALRIVDKRRTVFRDVLMARWNSIAEDVESLQRSCAAPNKAAVRFGDGRNPTSVGIRDDSNSI